MAHWHLILRPPTLWWVAVPLLTATTGLAVFLLLTAGWREALPWGLLAAFWTYLVIRVARASRSPRAPNRGSDAA